VGLADRAPDHREQPGVRVDRQPRDLPADPPRREERQQHAGVAGNYKAADLGAVHVQAGELLGRGRAVGRQRGHAVEAQHAVAAGQVG
jgi:hypothetical protein